MMFLQSTKKSLREKKEETGNALMHSSSLQGRFIVIFLTILIHEMKLSTGIKENSMFCGPESPDVSRNVFYFNKYFTISHANVKKN
jgi:hypothetical protein